MLSQTPTLAMCAMGLVQALILLALTPLFTGISRQIRAKMQSRRGPGIWQDYRDLVKLYKRQDVSTQHAGLIFRAAPYVLITVLLFILMSLPAIFQISLFSGAADIIAVVYLLTIFRFFFSLSGIDTDNSFGGIGSARELLLGILVEPTLILSLLVIALMCGTTNIGFISTTMAQGWVSPTAMFLAFLACAFATFVEMGRIPFDVAEAEQELQEGPLTEYSGPGLAMMKASLGLKQMTMAVLFMAVFLPFGSAASLDIVSIVIGFVALFVKLLVIFTIATVIECSMPRSRFVMINRVTWVGFSVVAMAYVFYLIGI